LIRPIIAKINTANEKNGNRIHPIIGMMLKIILPASPTIKRISA
jgi:hypothetical protein